MTPPTNFGLDAVDAATIDAQSVSEVTMDGDQVFGGAIPDSEDFEDNDLTGNYAGDTGAFSIQTGTVDEGTYALEASTSGSFQAIVRQEDAFDRSGLRINYRQYVTSSDNNTGGIMVSTSETGYSSADGYAFYVDPDNDPFMRFRRVDGGSNTLLDSSSQSPPVDSWVSGNVEFASDGTISWTHDGNTVSASDQTYTNLKLAFHGFNGVIYLDDITFETI